MEKSCLVCKIAGALLIIGGLNWGMVGFFQFNVVSRFLGDMTTASRVVYDLVGIAALLALIKCLKGCPACKKG